MSEISNDVVSSPETSSDEINEVSESNEAKEMDSNLSQELDDTYDSYLNDMSKYEHTDVSEKKEVEDTTDNEDGDSLDNELDNKYNEYVEDGEKSPDKEESKLDDVESNVQKIKCRNENLEGSQHPETGVPFEKRQVEVEGKQYEVVVPQFESKYDAQLPEDKLKVTDREQFKECNAQLKEEVSKNQELRDKFDEEQLEQIENGDTPDGYIWHHDADVGKMKLVDIETHQKTGHTGGRSIWGGGTDSR